MYVHIHTHTHMIKKSPGELKNEDTCHTTKKSHTKSSAFIYTYTHTHIRTQEMEIVFRQ